VYRAVAEYLLEAVCELVANALVHRDIDAWSEGMAVEVRHRHDRLVTSNPGVASTESPPK
jgi:ATP-dependent DNA helicase RecG